MKTGSLLFSRWATALLFVSLLPLGADAQQETLYMAVLNSRQHHWGNMQNPLVGTFASTDGGRSWNHLGWREYIRTFYVEAGPDGTLWAACGNGVLRSRDEGQRWTITTGWEITEVLKVDVDPSEASRIFAATAYGVFRSTSGGDAWEELQNGLHLRRCRGPQPSRVSSSWPPRRASTGAPTEETGGIRWRWKAEGVRCILQHPSRDSWWYVGTEDLGIWRSTDGGSDLGESSDGLNHPTVYTLAADPSSDLVLAGTHGGGVYRSEDGGRRWIQSAEGLTYADVHALVMMPSEPARVFAGTLGGGLFASTDGGRTWNFNSQEEAQVYGLSVSSARPPRREQ